jgi:hypothetical protein
MSQYIAHEKSTPVYDQYWEEISTRFERFNKKGGGRRSCRRRPGSEEFAGCRALAMRDNTLCSSHIADRAARRAGRLHLEPFPA